MWRQCKINKVRCTWGPQYWVIYQGQFCIMDCCIMKTNIPHFINLIYTLKGQLCHCRYERDPLFWQSHWFIFQILHSEQHETANEFCVTLITVSKETRYNLVVWVVSDIIYMYVVTILIFRPLEHKSVVQ